MNYFIFIQQYNFSLDIIVWFIAIEIDSDNKIKLNNDGQKEAAPEKFYDLIVNIKSIKDIDKGWKIKMNEKG